MTLKYSKELNALFCNVILIILVCAIYAYLWLVIFVYGWSFKEKPKNESTMQANPRTQPG